MVFRPYTTISQNFKYIIDFNISSNRKFEIILNRINHTGRINATANIGYSPRDFKTKGEATRKRDQMAKRNNAQRNLNTAKRMTPYDAKIAGTFAEKPKTPKKEPRKPTANEMKANNNTMLELTRRIGNLRIWKPVFEKNLKEMNEGKVGRPYEYSDALIIWMMTVLTAVDGKFDTVAGLFQSILKCLGIKAPSPTRLLERANILTAEYIAEPDKELSERYGTHIHTIGVSSNVQDRCRRTGIDSSGLALSSMNRWRGKKWKTEVKDRGWLHLHVLSDVDTGEFLAYAITDESVGDAPMLKCLVEKALEGCHKIEVVYADGAYSSDENWIYLCSEKKIRFVTSFKVNTAPRNNGCLARGEAARLWCSLPYDEWVKVSGYGTRWKCECGFSDFKRLFPEVVTARSLIGMIRQVMCRIDFHNMYKETRARIMGTTGNGIVVA